MVQERWIEHRCVEGIRKYESKLAKLRVERFEQVLKGGVGERLIWGRINKTKDVGKNHMGIYYYAE